MKVFWKIRCWSKEREFFDRYLVVQTEVLTPLDRYTLEYLVTEDFRYRPAIRHFRGHFKETSELRSELVEPMPRTVFVLDYFEFADGTPATLTQIIQARTGDPNWVALPSNFKEHDIEFITTPDSSVPADAVSHIRLSQEEVDCLAYFVRDGRELRESKYLKSRPPSLSSARNREVFWLENHSEELVRSFVTIFRRLYMDGEPGNFEKACRVYAQHFSNKRITRWVEGVKDEYKRELDLPAGQIWDHSQTFSTGRLLDVFIYTRYAHQPNARRSRQYRECFDEVGDESKLVWMFCCALLTVSMHFVNVLQYIEDDLERYLAASGKGPSIGCRPLIDSKATGSKEIVDAAILQKVHDYAVRMGQELWQESGAQPEKLPQHVKDAQRLLAERLQGLGVRFD
jgi:hypothetical protein